MLVWGLLNTQKNRKKLLEPSYPLVEFGRMPRPSAPKGNEYDRTTKMLLVILIIFLVTEIPDPIIVLFDVTRVKTFETDCIEIIAKLMKFLESLSAILNLFVYMIMSTAFRSTFFEFFNISKQDLTNCLK